MLYPAHSLLYLQIVGALPLCELRLRVYNVLCQQLHDFRKVLFQYLQIGLAQEKTFIPLAELGGSRARSPKKARSRYSKRGGTPL